MSLVNVFHELGALEEGHFLLSSGRHSARYVQCARLLQYPQEAEKAGRAISDLFCNEKVDVVVGPAMGGVIIAYEVARSLGVRSLFTERKEGRMELRRGFSIQPKERVLIVEDVVTTGASIQEVIYLLKDFDCEIVGIASMVDRTQGRVSFAYPYRSCVSLELQSHIAEECPLCKDGIPIRKPGSREVVSLLSIV